MEAIDGSRLITLTCSNFSELLIGGIWKLLNSQGGVDLEIKCGKQVVRVHRLMAEVFLSLSKADNCRIQASAIPWLANSSLDCLVEFMYRGKVSVRQDRIDSLLQVAKQFGFQALVDTIEFNKKGLQMARMNSLGVTMVMVNEVQQQQAQFPNMRPLRPKPAHGPLQVPSFGNLIIIRQPDIIVANANDKLLEDVVLTKFQENNKIDDKTYKCCLCQFETSKEPVYNRHRLSHGAAKLQGTETKNRLPIPRLSEGFPTGTKDGNLGVEKEGASSLLTIDNVDPVVVHSGTGRNQAGSQEQYKCLLCEFKTSQRRGFARHMRSHVTGALPLKRRERFKCQDCNFKSSFRSLLTKHQMSSHSRILEPKLFPCSQCHFVTRVKACLKSHVDTVHLHLAKTFLCRTCGKLFSSTTKLDQHMRVHTKEKPYLCPHCDYAASWKNALVMHVNAVHLNVKLYLCSYCSAQFVSSSHLKNHIRSHTNERSFKCTQCDYAANVHRTLKTHVESVHLNIRPHPCALCGKRFPSTDKLARHYRTHTRDKGRATIKRLDHKELSLGPVNDSTMELVLEVCEASSTS